MASKRTNTLESVLLTVELLRRIPRGRKITASELHAQLKDAGFDRDLRTIQRQLEILSGMECDMRRVEPACVPSNGNWKSSASISR